VDTQLKERLTGAVLLVAVMVLLVPEILSGPKRSSTPTTVTEAETNAEAASPMTGDSDAMRSYTINLDANDARRTPIATAAEPGDTSTPTPEPVAEPAAAPPRESAPSETATATSRDSSARAAAAPADRATERAGAFAVQVGSFGSRDNAQRLVSELKSKGFQAYIGPPTSGARPLIRVRVGPAQTRADAEQLRERLARAGQPGSIVDNP
jgi:DedD protein